MKSIVSALFLLFAIPLFAQTGATPDAFKSIAFLEGTWEAKTGASSGVTATGTYTFQPELRKSHPRQAQHK